MSSAGWSKVSVRTGKELYASARIHDDGVFESMGGGKTSISVGMPGSGKSTLLTQFAETSLYMKHGSKRKVCQQIATAEEGDIIDYSGCTLETIVWRIREFDSWPVFCNWKLQLEKKGLFNTKYKRLHLFIHEDDDLIFYCVNRDHKLMPVDNMPVIERYSTVSDLIGKIHQNQINAICEPQSYTLSENLQQILMEKNLEGVKKPGKSSEVVKYDELECKPAIWWFDFLFSFQTMNRMQFVTIIIDEWDDVSPARNSGPVWHLTDLLADQFVDFRRNNISCHFSVHACDFVDWRILRRANYFLWYAGGVPSKACSRSKYRSLTTMQPIGNFIIEDKEIKFGRMNFDKLPIPMPVARIEGLKNRIPFLDKKQRKFFGSYMKEQS